MQTTLGSLLRDNIMKTNLRFEAEFWMDETGRVEMPRFDDARRAELNADYGLFTDAEDKHMMGMQSDFATRANFCLLIAAALESEQ